MDKQTLRNLIKERKQQFGVDELIIQSVDVTQRLEQNKLFKFAHTVLLYYSMEDEVNTHGLVAALLHQGRRVLLPRVKDDQNLDIVPVTSGNSLLPQGKYHIMEPTGEPFTDYSDIDIAIVPGIAFTQDGKRLGRGKGYYDRLLVKMPSVYKMGVCFPFQIVKDIPTDENDILMDEVFV